MNIAVVGAGRGGRSILAAICGLPDVKVVGISDLDENAPGIVLARELGVKTFADCLDMLRAGKPDIIIEATGVPKVQKMLHENKPEKTTIIDASAALLMMIMV